MSVEQSDGVDLESILHCDESGARSDYTNSWVQLSESGETIERRGRQIEWLLSLSPQTRPVNRGFSVPILLMQGETSDTALVRESDKR